MWRPPRPRIRIGRQADDSQPRNPQTCGMTINQIRGLSFSDVTKRYGPVTALNGFSADIAPGRITAFLGANGSGKT